MIALTPLANKGVISGVVRDAETGQALPAATITLTGDSNASLTTDNAGFYSIEIDPGNVTIAISATGYDPVSGSTDISAAQHIDFSPQLYLAGTAPGGTTVAAKVTVVDADTTLPIEGALISIEGTAT